MHSCSIDFNRAKMFIRQKAFKATHLATAKIISFCSVFIMTVQDWIHLHPVKEKTLLASKHVEIIPFPITIMIIPEPTYISFISQHSCWGFHCREIRVDLNCVCIWLCERWWRWVFYGGNAMVHEALNRTNSSLVAIEMPYWNIKEACEDLKGLIV